MQAGYPVLPGVRGGAIAMGDHAGTRTGEGTAGVWLSCGYRRTGPAIRVTAGMRLGRLTGMGAFAIVMTITRARIKYTTLQFALGGYAAMPFRFIRPPSGDDSIYFFICPRPESGASVQHLVSLAPRFQASLPLFHQGARDTNHFVGNKKTQ